VTIQNGCRVSLQYTLSLGDGTVVDSNVDGEPLTYTHGEGQIIPGLERELEGLAEGVEQSVTVAPEDAYGPKHAEAIQEVDKSRVPDGAHRIGAALQGQTADGDVMQARVTEVKDDTVIVDFNHPLAGETLHFHVKVLGVEASGAG
jgi:FKBP-type peptidyl-prolyl cis-trans isomerase SlyD